MYKFNKLSKESKIAYFSAYCRVKEHFNYEKGCLHLNDKALKMVVILAGYKSKKTRIMKKIATRFLITALVAKLERK